MLGIFAQIVRLNRMRNGQVEFFQTLRVDFETTSLVLEDFRWVHPRIPRELGNGRANHLLFLQARVRDLGLEVGNERVIGVKTHVKPLANALVEVLAQADALGELGPIPDRFARIATLRRLDGRFLQDEVVVARTRDEVFALERHAVGQDVVGDLAGVGHPDIVVDDEFHLVDDVEPTLAVGLLMDGVAAGHDERLVGAVRSLSLSEPVSHANGVRFHGSERLAVGEHDGGVVEVQREALQLQALDDASARTPELTA